MTTVIVSCFFYYETRKVTAESACQIHINFPRLSLGWPPTTSIIISICKTLHVVNAMTACDLACNCYVNQITWLLSSYVKISRLLWLHYKSCLSHQTKMLVVWHFSGVYIINQTLHDCLEIRNFSSCVEKFMFHELVIFEEKILYLCAEIKGKARDIRGNLVKSHHLKHHTEAVCKILKTSYVVYFQNISIPHLEGHECCW